MAKNATCTGCSEDRELRTYLAKFAGQGEAEEVEYCLDCAEYARLDWNGETLWLIDPEDKLEERMVRDLEEKGTDPDEARRIVSGSMVS